METTVKLSLEKEYIEYAERLAMEKGLSFSEMIEEYIKRLKPVKSLKKKTNPERGLADMLGVVKVDDDFDFDYKRILEEELMKKYGN